MTHTLENTTPDLRHDRAETDAFTRSVRIENLTHEIQGDPELLAEAVGDYLQKHDAKGYFALLSGLFNSSGNDRLSAAGLRGNVMYMTKWYAMQLIDAVPARVRFVGKNVPAFLRRRSG